MSKMHSFSNKFSKTTSPLILHFGDLKFCDLAKLRFFKLIMMKSNLKKISYEVTSVTLLLLRHQTNVTRFSILPHPKSKFLATPVWYHKIIYPALAKSSCIETSIVVLNYKSSFNVA